MDAGFERRKQPELNSHPTEIKRVMNSNLQAILLATANN
jgi:hypothetical protein